MVKVVKRMGWGRAAVGCPQGEVASDWVLLYVFIVKCTEAQQGPLLGRGGDVWRVLLSPWYSDVPWVISLQHETCNCVSAFARCAGIALHVSVLISLRPNVN
jgi:hypothetical protein